MTIKVGDRLPTTTFTVMTADGPKPQTTDEIFKGKKVVLFAVPGAFTPTCHKNHLPGFLASADQIKAKGIDTIAVTGVNDVFVMDAWKKNTGAEGKIEFLADGSAAFANAIGLSVDLGARGLGTRSQRGHERVRGDVPDDAAFTIDCGGTRVRGRPVQRAVLRSRQQPAHRVSLHAGSGHRGQPPPSTRVAGRRRSRSTPGDRAGARRRRLHMLAW